MSANEWELACCGEGHSSGGECQGAGMHTAFGSAEPPHN